MAKLKLLSVDDDAVYQSLIKILLGGICHLDKVLIAMDADDGEKILEEESPDIVLIDLMMVRRNGLDFISKNADYFKDDNKIGVVITADARLLEEHSKWLMEHNIHKVLLKPIPNKQLIKFIVYLCKKILGLEDVRTEN